MISALHALTAIANTAIAMPNTNIDAPATIQLTHKCKVLEVIDTPTYTYLRVTGDRNPLWFAAYKASIAKDDIVDFSGGVTLNNFHIKSLNRTFDTIVFVGTVMPESK